MILLCCLLDRTILLNLELVRLVYLQTKGVGTKLNGGITEQKTTKEPVKVVSGIIQKSGKWN